MLKELENRPIRFVYEATLSNGAEIFVRPDGTAVDKHGREYKEITDSDSSGDLIPLGWEYA